MEIVPSLKADYNVISRFKEISRSIKHIKLVTFYVNFNQ